MIYKYRNLKVLCVLYSNHIVKQGFYEKFSGQTGLSREFMRSDQAEKAREN